MLKNRRLLGLLTSPEDPDGKPLDLEGDTLCGARWPIPVVDGIPDFVTYAPVSERPVRFTVPYNDNPSPAVLMPPGSCNHPPPWFQEEKHKYELLKRHPKGFLLDAGCGLGNRETFERLGYDYIGIDIVFDSGQRTKGKADLDVVADCHRLPLPSSSMEALNSTALLEHVYHPIVAVQEFYRVLRPGGLVVGSCSFLEAEHFDSQYHLSWLGVYRLLTLAGFVVQNIYAGLSVWEMHAGSIFLGLPGHNLMGRLLRHVYLLLVNLKSKESATMRLLRHAAVVNFVAVKNC